MIDITAHYNERASEVIIMNVGDTIKFEFAGKKKEGVVYKLFSNSVYLKVDFERDKGKIVKRKLIQIAPKAKKLSKNKKKEK